MLLDTAAPWAEPVFLTAEDLAARPDDSWRYELIRGRLVRMPPTGYEHGNVTLQLLRALDRYVESHTLGRISPAETGFLISAPGEPDTVLAPDLAFITADRLPQPGTRDWTSFPRLAPDLVIEIASPSQHVPHLADKARLWLSAGVRLVWVIWPAARRVDVWHPDWNQPAATLTDTDNLDGEDILPGFSFPVAHLFI